MHLILLTCVPPLSPFSQAWRDIARMGESRAGDAGSTNFEYGFDMHCVQSHKPDCVCVCGMLEDLAV